MGVVAIIPARLASTRLPEKPLLKQTGKYLIQHVVENVQRCPAISRAIVATDDQRILDACREFGAEAVMTRCDHQSGTDRIAEVAKRLTDNIIVNVQGDEPELPPGHIVAAVEALHATKADMATLAAPLDDAEVDDPNRVKVVLRADGRALYFSRSRIPFNRDGGPLPAGLQYLLHMGLYVYRRDFLLRYPSMSPAPLEKAEKLEQLRALYHGHDIAVAVVKERSAGIDTREDYAAFAARQSRRR